VLRLTDAGSASPRISRTPDSFFGVVVRQLWVPIGARSGEEGGQGRREAPVAGNGDMATPTDEMQAAATVAPGLRDQRRAGPQMLPPVEACLSAADPPIASEPDTAMHNHAAQA
jgi:hypothetical protein